MPWELDYPSLLGKWIVVWLLDVLDLDTSTTWPKLARLKRKERGREREWGLSR